jgi:hypothetical protein
LEGVIFIKKQDKKFEFLLLKFDFEKIDFTLKFIIYNYNQKMASKPSIPKGTRDFSPAEVAKQQYIIQIIKSIEIWFSTQKRLHSKNRKP